MKKIIGLSAGNWLWAAFSGFVAAANPLWVGIPLLVLTGAAILKDQAQQDYIEALDDPVVRKAVCDSRKYMLRSAQLEFKGIQDAQDRLSAVKKPTDSDIRELHECGVRLKELSDRVKALN